MTGNVLDETRSWLARFVAVADERDLDLLVLWVAHTHAVEALGCSPRLLVTSPTHGSGKSTTLGLVAMLSSNGKRLGMLPSAPVMRTLLGRGVTLCLDEAGKSLPRAGATPSESQRLALAMLDDGYREPALVTVNVPSVEGGWTIEDIDVFGPLAIGGNALALPAESVSRCLTLRLFKDAEGLAEAYDPEVHDIEGYRLHDLLGEWGDSVRGGVRVAVDLPDALAHGRPRELWRAMARTAVAAGGDWPERCARLAERAADEAEAEVEDGPGEERPHETLVRHLGEIWPVASEFEATADLLVRLHGHAPEAWQWGGPTGKALTPHALGRMVRHYGVVSKRQSRTSPRGYARADLARFWTKA